jgi:hypothetical protein
MINIFDSPNFAGPETGFGRTTFGRITAVRGFPRLLQLLVRFAF